MRDVYEDSGWYKYPYNGFGSAIAKAACEGNDPADIVVTDYDKEKAKRFAQEYGACSREPASSGEVPQDWTM